MDVDAIAGKFVARFEVTRDGQENTVAVDDGAVRSDEKGAIGVAIEGDTKSSIFRGNALLQFFKMQRAATGVDVAAIGFDADTHDVAAKGGKQLGTKLIGGAIGTIENDAEAFERGPVDDATTEEIEILVMKRIICFEVRQWRGNCVGAMFEDASFDFFLHGIRKLHAFVGEEFDAIVLIRIVRGGNDDTDVKIVQTNEASDTGSSENSGERNGSAPFEQTSGDNGGDVRAGFARVSTD